MKRTWIALGLVAIVVGALTPLTVDYRNFWQAGRDLLAGQNPYTVHAGYYSPLYVAVAYLPLALMPYEVAYRVQAGLMLFVYVVALVRLLKQRPLVLIALAGPFALMSVLYGNLEGWVLLGATLPAPLGIWLLLVKPQIGWAAAAVMIWSEYRRVGARRAVALSLPLMAVYAGSLELGMLATTPQHSAWDVSVWPYGLGLGLPLAALAVRRNDASLGLLAATLAAPYLAPMSWGAIQPALSRTRLGALTAVGLCWLIFVCWRWR